MKFDFTVISGWRRNLLCYVLGAFAALAMPPFYLFPLLVLAYSGLGLLIVRAPTPRRALADGWWWGWGFFTVGLYWMCIALLTDPVKFGWLIPFTLIGLHGALALYTAFAAWCIYRLRPSRFWLPAAFAAVWMVFETLRGHLFTGFPWNLPGYAWVFSGAMSQSVSAIGIYGLSFLTVWAAAAPLAGKRYAAAVWSGMALIAALGAWRLSHAEERFVPGVRLRLVQADIKELAKQNPALHMQQLGLYLHLTRSPGYDKITHVIWPETAVPFIVNRDPALIQLLMSVAPEHGALITGTIRSEGEGENWHVWNTLAVIERERGIVAYYDKHHLVPFGEFVPMRHWLPISKLTPGPVDFSRGPGPESLVAPGAPPFSPLICYEAIFPEEAAPPGRQAAWLLNVTNDAWFGDSTGPYQHFAMARMRAVEQGLPLVRAANTGISAVTDAYGRIMAELPLGVRGVLDSGLPQKTPAATIYSRFRNDHVLLLIYAAIILIAYTKRDNRKLR